MSTGVVTAVADPVVQEHVRWMQLRGLAEETIRLRTAALRLLSRHAGRPPLALGPADLDSWQRSLTCSASSRRAYVIQVTGFYRWAAGDGQLRSDNPAAVLVRPKVPRGLPRPIGEADLAAAIAGAPQPVRCWLELAAYQGLRACEIAWLERRDVLEEQGMLIVRGKGDKERVLPLGSTARRALRDYGMPRTGRVFAIDGHQPAPRTVSNRANRHLRRMDIPATLHQCRHRFASRALEVVADVRVVQELLGHSSPSTTAIYTLASPTRAAEAVAGLDRLRAS